MRRSEFNVRDIEEAILILVLFIDATHKRSCRRQNLVDEDENGLLRWEFDALADNVDKLADGEICRYQVLLLVDGGDVRFLDLLADDLLLWKPVSYVEMSGETEQGRTGEGTDPQYQVSKKMNIHVPECDQHTSDEYAQLRPCASRRGARPWTWTSWW